MSQEDFLSLDTDLTGLGRSNCNKGIVPALRNTTQSTTATVDNGADNDSFMTDVEPAYFNVGEDNTDVTYHIQFPLRLIKNTLFSIDKNLFFGKASYLSLYFGTISKVCYQSNSNDNPSAGTKLPYTGNATISNIKLMLAVENNNDIKQLVMDKFNTKGISLTIPFVFAQKNSNQNTNQVQNYELNSGNGRSLIKVLHSIYNQRELLDTMYDRSNTDVIADVYSANNQKLFTYYTELNSRRIQDITLDCTTTSASPLLDYMYHRRQLKGSISMNSNIYQYNWFHCDDFSDFGPSYDHDNHGELISGIPLTSVPSLKWSFNGLTLRPVNNNFFHYTWFVLTRKLTLTPTVIECN
ncbi:MAG TPA: hypothetical protein PLS50_01635 [Candidatus Dojkabacteria bacterium]|nr:hypothetical protein [Candidatus Dojkabacteria bacterium]